jgi:DNA-binding NarL/FixJ family response regulator
MADHTGFPSPRRAAPPLVGREREQAALRDALAAALAGRGSLVLIGGEAGIGKTALAEAQIAETRTQGILAVVGRAYDLAETPPYGPWREIFERIPRHDGLPPLPAAVLPPDRDGESLTSQDAIIARVRAHLAALAATRPLVLLLEDLHWADSTSLETLRVVGRSLDGVPILLLATYRADEIPADHPLAALLPALVREAHAARLDLPPLDAAAVAALVAARYSLAAAERDRLADYLLRRTEGNALFLTELLRVLESAGALRRAGECWTLGDLDRVPVPPLLRQVIAGRLGRLGDDDRRLLAVAAVIGQEPPFDLWSAVGAADEGALLAAAERAIAARVLEPTEAGVRFVHALIREALYAGVLAPRRRAWHRRAAEATLATPHPDPDAVAYHLRQAGDPRAAEWLIRAGARALQSFAWITAAERYEAALALMERAESAAQDRAVLLLTLAQLRRYTNIGQSIALLDESARLADAAGDVTLAAAARFDQGHHLVMLGDVQRGLRQMAAALPVLDVLSAADLARLPTMITIGAAGGLQFHRGVLAGFLATTGHLDAAEALVDRLGDAGPAVSPRIPATQGFLNFLRGSPDAARRGFSMAVARFTAAGLHVETAIWCNFLRRLAYQYHTDRPAEWAHFAAEATRHLTLGLGMHAEALLPAPALMHQLARGGDAGTLRAAAALLATPALKSRTNFGFAELVVSVARQQGETDLAWELVRAALPAGPTTEPGVLTLTVALHCQRLAAALALDAGELPTARAWLDAHDRWLAWSGAIMGRAEGALGWAAYHSTAGDHRLARQHAERALAHASDPRQPLALVAAHRLLGELDTNAGQHSEAAAHLDAALALAAACDVPYERALTLLALAELCAAAGDAAGARAHLDVARALLHPLAARPALARADALAATLARLVASGPVPAFPAGLSAREVEVLRLIVAGRANHEIAAALCISPNTVLRHVSHILAKTGTANRAAAAVFALRHGLAAPDAAPQ